MPQLTVSMPVHNGEDYIYQAVESVLKNKDIDLELIVVDDCSNDNTAKIVKSIDDPRLKLIQTKKHMGMSCCHNLVISQCRSPYIAHVDSDDFVLQGCFREMIAILEDNPKTGLISCMSFCVDRDGNVTRESYRRFQQKISKKISGSIECRESLFKFYNNTSLNIYRADVFDELGKFDEKPGSNYLFDMALKTISIYQVYLLPELLYAQRITDKPSKFDQILGATVGSLKKISIYNHSYNKQKSKNLQYVKNISGTLMFIGEYYYSEIHKKTLKTTKTVSKTIKQIIPSLYTFLSNKFYNAIVNNISWSSLNILSFSNKETKYRDKRIAYYTWNFPVLSETFIQREVAALRKSGLIIEIIADGYSEPEILDKNSKELVEKTIYLNPIDSERLSSYKKFFFHKNPVVYLILFLYVVTNKYGKNKSLEQDKLIFSKSIFLAGLLKDANINHIHSPWANNQALISLVASRLLGIPYTVQARAVDIHRKDRLEALESILVNAKFVVTNCNYNESYLKSIISSKHRQKINTIYNGINLNQFKPSKPNQKSNDRTNILTVSRITEQKGIVYLLKACKILKERGYSFRCDIVGPQTDFNYFMKLKVLHIRYGLENLVFFHKAESFNAVKRRYLDTDFVVLPCIVVTDNGKRDITPNILIESMAMKLPVISTNIAGIPEIVDDGVNGLLVSPNREQALADAMIKLIDDKILRSKFGENARKKIIERFNVEKNIQKYINLFSE